jgi:hypothetical protein
MGFESLSLCEVGVGTLTWCPDRPGSPLGPAIPGPPVLKGPTGALVLWESPPPHSCPVGLTSSSPALNEGQAPDM